MKGILCFFTRLVVQRDTREERGDCVTCSFLRSAFKLLCRDLHHPTEVLSLPPPRYNHNTLPNISGFAVCIRHPKLPAVPRKMTETLLMTCRAEGAESLLSFLFWGVGFQPPSPALRPSNVAFFLPTQSLVQMVLPSGVLPSLNRSVASLGDGRLSYTPASHSHLVTGPFPFQ